VAVRRQSHQSAQEITEPDQIPTLIDNLINSFNGRSPHPQRILMI
jgi:hypothetical protein